MKLNGKNLKLNSRSFEKKYISGREDKPVIGRQIRLW